MRTRQTATRCMNTTIDLDLIAQFAAVAETLSFSAPATKQRLTKGTVSRAIARLEALLGVELVHRTTRQVALSAAGLALYERAVAPLAALRQAVATLPDADERPSGTLRLTAPVAMGSHPLGAVVAHFVARFPEVQLDVHVTNRAVDLVGEGFDLALRVHVAPPKDSSLAWRGALGHSELRFYASPAYDARRGAPREIGDPAQVWSWSRLLDARRLWHQAVVRAAHPHRRRPLRARGDTRGGRRGGDAALPRRRGPRRRRPRSRSRRAPGRGRRHLPRVPVEQESAAQSDGVPGLPARVDPRASAPVTEGCKTTILAAVREDYFAQGQQ